MMKTNLYDVFKKIDDKFTYDLIEISVKPRNTTLIFKGAYLMDVDLKELISMTEKANQGFVYVEDETIHYAINYNEDESIPEVSLPFIKILEEISERVCACPILEFIISDKYIKMFLDKRDLTVTDLLEYEDIFGEHSNGTLMLHTQRPYLLFVNAHYDIDGEEND